MKKLLLSILCSLFLACSNSSNDSPTDGDGGGGGSPSEQEVVEYLRDTDCSAPCNINKIEEVVSTENINIGNSISRIEAFSHLLKLKSSNQLLDRKVEAILLSNVLEKNKNICTPVQYNSRLSTAVYRKTGDRGYQRSEALIRHLDRLLSISENEIPKLLRESNDRLIGLHASSSNNSEELKIFAEEVITSLRTKVYGVPEEQRDFSSNLEATLRELVEVEKKIFNDSQLEGILGFSSNPLVMNQRLIRLYNNHLLGLMLRIRHTGKIDQPQQTGVLLLKHSEALTDLRNQLESSSELYKIYGYTGYRYINGLESRISALNRALSGQKCLGSDCSDLINTIKTKVNACKN